MPERPIAGAVRYAASKHRSMATKTPTWRVADMFPIILTGTDGSDSGDRAVTFAKELARDQTARLIVVHVDELVPGHGGAHHIQAMEPELKRRSRIRSPRRGPRASTSNSRRIRSAPAARLTRSRTPLRSRALTSSCSAASAAGRSRASSWGASHIGCCRSHRAPCSSSPPGSTDSERHNWTESSPGHRGPQAGAAARSILLRILPLTGVGAREMIGSIRGAPLLTDYRGAPKVVGATRLQP